MAKKVLSSRFLTNFICLGFCGLVLLIDVGGVNAFTSEERSNQIKRETNHCWRRYDGFNMNLIVGKKDALKKPYGILCTFKCNLFFMTSFPNCEFIYDYKLSCYLFTSLPDCVSVKCTFLDYFS